MQLVGALVFPYVVHGEGSHECWDEENVFGASVSFNIVELLQVKL